MLKYFFWSWLVSLSCQGQEKEKVTQTRDKLTLDKARFALAESKKGPGEIFVPLFDLPKNVYPEIIDTKLTYRKALEALKREDAEIKKLSALVREKQSLLAKMTMGRCASFPILPIRGDNTMRQKLFTKGLKRSS